jgi:hypothetical protein
MKRFANLNLRRALVHAALLLSTILMISRVPSYGQEFDPTWYDPWASATVVAHAAQPQAAKQEKPHAATVATVKVKTAAAGQHTAKAHVKAASRTRPS